MKSFKKIIIKVLIAIIFLSVVIWAGSNNGCRLYENYKAQSFEGPVIKKFINPDDHSFPIVYILGKDDIHEINFSYDTVVYNAIKKGDTISKMKNDKFMYIKNNKKSIKAIMQFECDSTLK